MTKKRKKVWPPHEERGAITAFCNERIKPKKGGKVHLQDVYAMYKSYRKDKGLVRTVLSLDGFGRVLPPMNAERKPIWIDGKLKRGFLGAVLV
jgi:phage/plasmid-associated DNA primase